MGNPNRVLLKTTLDSATVDFVAESVEGPPVSDEIAAKIDMCRTNLPDEKLKVRLDRELCPSNVKIFTKKVNLKLFNTRGGQMGPIRNGDLELQNIQKLINKAMIPIVRLADQMH